MKILWTIYGIGLVSSFFMLRQEKELEESIENGKDIYTDFCVTCHLPNGKGVEKAFPPLADSDYLLNNREASIRAVKYGQSGEITVNGITYNNSMAPLGLTDEEVADVMNYILNSWGNTSEEMVTTEEVSHIEK
ncbi:c-type cytochrome [Sinomicrobium sp. M5D2P9]